MPLLLSERHCSSHHPPFMGNYVKKLFLLCLLSLLLAFLLSAYFLFLNSNPSPAKPMPSRPKNPAPIPPVLGSSGAPCGRTSSLTSSSAITGTDSGITGSLIFSSGADSGVGSSLMVWFLWKEHYIFYCCYCYRCYYCRYRHHPESDHTVSADPVGNHW